MINPGKFLNPARRPKRQKDKLAASTIKPKPTLTDRLNSLIGKRKEKKKRTYTKRNTEYWNRNSNAPKNKY